MGSNSSKAAPGKGPSKTATAAKPAPKPAAKPAAKAPSKPAAKPAPKAPVKPAAKPSPKPAAKPAPKAPSKPARGAATKAMAPLVVEVDGRPLAEVEAGEVWRAFSAHMDAHEGDLAGFAKARGWASVAPTYRRGTAVLIVAS